MNGYSHHVPGTITAVDTLLQFGKSSRRVRAVHAALPGKVLHEHILLRRHLLRPHPALILSHIAAGSEQEGNNADE